MANALSDSLLENLNTIKKDLGNSSDIILTEFNLGEYHTIKVAVIYVNSLVDETFIHESILKTLMTEIRKIDLNADFFKKEELFQIIKFCSISVNNIIEVDDFDILYQRLLFGDTVILIDYYSKAFLASSQSFKGRDIQEPSTQASLKGPKEGFIEILTTNIGLIRRRIRDTNLRIETVIVGKRTQTEIAIIYINGLAKTEIVDEVKKRINRLDVNYILQSTEIEELIRDEKYTIYPTIYTTERPDSLAAGILHGRVGIIINGTPFALLVPALFIHFFQASEDYDTVFFAASFKRILRFSSYFFTLLAPGTLVALLSFHHEMIQTSLYFSILTQRTIVPFPIAIEVLLLEIMFEVITEAAIRMPTKVGPTLSIVGALVLGQAAVEAGVFSSIAIITIAITGITSNMSASRDLVIATRLLRFIFIFLGATFGIVGITIGVFINTLHLCSLKSFNVFYLSSLYHFNVPAQRDSILRLLSRKKLKPTKKKARGKQYE